MFDVIGKPLFTALAAAAERVLGPADPCATALRLAGTSGTPADIEAAEALFKALPDEQRDPILAASHEALRSDPWSLMPRPEAPKERILH